LVVEDDQALGAFLTKGLEAEGHRVQWAQDGETALVMAAADPADLLVLDLGLPRLDGMDVLAALQVRHDDAAVLVLTGRNDLQSRVRCLDLGADDCLLKPFSFIELAARCRALLRRRLQASEPLLRHRDLVIHRIHHKVERAGLSIDLTTREFALLEYLLVHRGECVSRTELLAEVWGNSTDTGTNIVDVYINYVRRKIDVPPSRENLSLIETVRGIGYRVGQPLPVLPSPTLQPAAPYGMAHQS
jgi:DNA-binding response OmpR family regulator